MVQCLLLLCVPQQPHSFNSEAQAAKLNMTPARTEPQQEQKGSAARKNTPQPYFKLQPLSLQAQVFVFEEQAFCFSVVFVSFCVSSPLEGFLVQA